MGYPIFYFVVGGHAVFCKTWENINNIEYVINIFKKQNI